MVPPDTLPGLPSRNARETPSHDYLYFVSLGKKPKNDRLNAANLDKQKALHYASLHHRTGLDKLLKEVL